MNKQIRKLISGMMTVMFTVTLASGIGTGQAYAAGNNLAKSETLKASVAKALAKKYAPSEKISTSSKYGEDLLLNENKLTSKESSVNSDPNEVVRVILQLTDKPTAEAGAKSLPTIQAAQASIKSKVKSLKNVQIRHTYTNLVNGFSMTIKRSEISKVKAMAGVKSVTEATKYYPEMTTAKSLTQVYDTWKDLGIKGEGMVVSIIDTGINYTHKDMRLSDASKEKLTDKTPEGPGKYFTDKVPYGYNFAEMNTKVIPEESQHGMHVAGIVGANCPEEKEGLKAIKGVAPECQLLAMKVFANDPAIGGAFSDDIVAAIEDSVKHGADVINMSLGSHSGFQDANDPEQKAVTNATNNGVMVVISGGNQQYSTAPYRFGNMPDAGVSGSPGIATDSLQVASYENTTAVFPALDYTSTSGNGTLNYEVNEGNINPVGVVKGALEVVDCGLGQVSDLAGKDLTGKIALISRGAINFTEKQVNAQNAGAKAVIIYNNRPGSIGRMADDPSLKIPLLRMFQADGLTLKSIASNGLKIQFNKNFLATTNADDGDMSDFSSWGSAPNLEFKPEITAVGGNVWSTVGSAEYDNYSGTSMAAPHAAGSEALILQSIKAKNKDLSGRALVELAKATSINTATIKMDKNHVDVPYSPRRQGSGLIQIENAIKNSVTVKGDDGKPTVALKEIGKTTSFTLNLKNYDSKPATYKLEDASGVLTEQSASFIDTMSYDVKIAGATIAFDKDTIEVPANGTATVNVTITLPNDCKTEEFVEGFVKFTSDVNPSLVVPYMGFYGDWSKQDIIDKPMWDGSANYGTTTMMSLGSDSEKPDYLGCTGYDKNENPMIDPNKIAISPNGDKLMDNAYPWLTMLRNAKTMNVQLLDKDHKLVSQIATDENIRKNCFSASGDTGHRASENWMWNGEVFNSATGKMELAKEGQYYLDYVTKVDFANAKEQHFEMPVKLDLTAPEVALTSPTESDSTNYRLQWTVSDSLSGDTGLSFVSVNGVEQKDAIVVNINGVYACNLTLLPSQINTIAIGVADYAGNITVKEVSVKETTDKISPAFELTFDNLYSRMAVSKANLKVTGKVNYVPTEFKINGKNVKIKSDLTFSTDIKFVEGRNLVAVYAVVTVDGKKVEKDFSYKVDYDATAPVLTLTSPEIGKDNKILTDKDVLTIAGKVSDNGPGYKLYINGQQKLSVELDGEIGAKATERSFNCEVPVIHNSIIEIKVVDLFGNATIKTINVLDLRKLEFATVTNIEDGKAYKTNITPKVVVNQKDTKVTVTLNDEAYNGKAITKEGSYTLKVSAIYKENYKSEVVVKFTIDKTAPVITVENVVNNEKYTSVTPIISFNEDIKECKVTVDGKVYNNEPITKLGRHTLTITAVDMAGNKTVKTITFTIIKPL